MREAVDGVFCLAVMPVVSTTVLVRKARHVARFHWIPVRRWRLRDAFSGGGVYAMRWELCWLLCGLLVCSGIGFAETDLRKEIDALRKEVELMRQEKVARSPIGTGVVDKMVDNKYGPNAKVTTKQGKLKIGGLLQIWCYSIENDNLGFFGDRTPGVAGVGDTNEGKDNDSYAIRRCRLKFTMDIHENIQAFVQMGMELAFNGRPAFGSNLGRTYGRAVARVVPPNPDNGRNILLDAYIKIIGLIPHHDTKIGQFLPRVGLEGMMSGAALDFVERSMIGLIPSGLRDIGTELHGTWLDDRLQYWLGMYNSPNTFLTLNNHNIADTNDLKSFLFTLQVRPVWKNETWGSLELGGTAQFNETGEAGDPGGTDGLNMTNTDNIRYYGWAQYMPGGPVKGWWLKGEYAWIRARLASGVWTWSPATQEYVMATAANQTNPRAFDTSGWYVSTGYKLSDSIWADDLPWWLKPAEFAFRYETFGNIQVADLAMPNQRHDVWNTSIYTAGINYYIKGNNVKVQVNYNWVREPNEDHDGGPTPRRIREVDNDNLVVNFQVAW